MLYRLPSNPRAGVNRIVSKIIANSEFSPILKKVQPAAISFVAISKMIVVTGCLEKLEFSFEVKEQEN